MFGHFQIDYLRSIWCILKNIGENLLSLRGQKILAIPRGFSQGYFLYQFFTPNFLPFSNSFLKKSGVKKSKKIGVKIAKRNDLCGY